MSIMRMTKEKGFTTFVVGHINKEGNIAGPKVLEHMVDCVLYFEGERSTSFRILRAGKNRFGSTNEIDVFEWWKSKQNIEAWLAKRKYQTKIDFDF